MLHNDIFSDKFSTLVSTSSDICADVRNDQISIKHTQTPKLQKIVVTGLSLENSPSTCRFDVLSAPPEAVPKSQSKQEYLLNKNDSRLWGKMCLLPLSEAIAERLFT